MKVRRFGKSRTATASRDYRRAPNGNVSAGQTVASMQRMADIVA